MQISTCFQYFVHVFLLTFCSILRNSWSMGFFFIVFSVSFIKRHNISYFPLTAVSLIPELKNVIAYSTFKHPIDKQTACLSIWGLKPNFLIGLMSSLFVLLSSDSCVYIFLLSKCFSAILIGIFHAALNITSSFTV